MKAQTATPRVERSGTLLRLLLWSPAIVIVLSAAAVVGGVALFMAPLLALFYGVFSWIAWMGADREEVQ